ncbi:MAG: protein kinase [Myxococcales bacterium]|nr:protein kinase [Myxococcales bacterium]
MSGAPLVKLADFGVSLLLSDSNNPLSAHSGRFVARLPEPSAMAAREGEDSGDAVAVWLPSHDEGQATPIEDDADVPAATVSLSPEAPSPAAVYPSPPPVAGALPAVIRSAAADDETVHPGAAASPAHTAALRSASAEDVGLAESGRLTVDGMLVGTPMYMAPELWNLGSQQAGPASDIFSFGVIACELLTGALPFKSAPVLARWQGESVTIAKVRQLRPDVPRELADLVDGCLTEEPSQRPVARALVTRLSDLAAALKQPFTSD